MPTKATHTGECQVCGRRQKLPRGMLSKHGYTTRCGFFEGVCFGAEHLPFEQDKTLVDEAIALAQRQAANLRARIAATRASTDPDNVTHEVYEVGSRRSLTGYFLYTGRVVATEQNNGNGYTYYTFAFHYSSYGQPQQYQLRYAGQGSTLSEVVRYLNDQEARRLERTLDEIDRYVRWQQQRVKGWQPRPLRPIEPQTQGAER